MKMIEMSGERFGLLTVCDRANKSDSSGNVYWNCVCECGKEIVVSGCHLRSGHTKSCGCFFAEAISNANRVHGQSDTRLHNIWMGMINRCELPTFKNYANYGARGISVCKAWRQDFQSFFDWSVSNGYRNDLSIDRIDNDGNYEPSNCQWVTAKVQANNTRRNVRVEIDGISRTVSEWSSVYDISQLTIAQRIRRGWDPVDAVTIPASDGRRFSKRTNR